MFAAHYKLGGLIALIDWNKQQLDGFVKDVMDVGDLGAKFSAFGWHTQAVDGHEPGRIKAAITNAKSVTDKPSAIILDTIKGYGCDFAEGIAGNHHMTFTQEKMDKALNNATRTLEEARAAVKAH